MEAIIIGIIFLWIGYYIVRLFKIKNIYNNYIFIMNEYISHDNFNNEKFLYENIFPIKLNFSDKLTECYDLEKRKKLNKNKYCDLNGPFESILKISMYNKYKSEIYKELNCPSWWSSNIEMNPTRNDLKMIYDFLKINTLEKVEEIINLLYDKTQKYNEKCCNEQIKTNNKYQLLSSDNKYDNIKMNINFLKEYDIRKVKKFNKIGWFVILKDDIFYCFNILINLLK